VHLVCPRPAGRRSVGAAWLVSARGLRLGPDRSGGPAWLASPIDLLPEFLPGIGPLDDIVVAALVLRRVSRRLGRDYLRAHWPGGDDGFALVERLL